jgi:hypothetical protein
MPCAHYLGTPAPDEQLPPNLCTLPVASLPPQHKISGPIAAPPVLGLRGVVVALFAPKALGPSEVKALGLAGALVGLSAPNAPVHKASSDRVQQEALVTPNLDL